MANRKTPTKRECFNALLNIEAVAEQKYLVEFINHELALLDKKNASERKPSAKDIAKREADADMRTAIVAEMEQDKLYSGADICALPTPSASQISTAKAAYLMRDLVADGVVVKSVDKRHTFYALAPAV